MKKKIFSLFCLLSLVVLSIVGCVDFEHYKDGLHTDIAVSEVKKGDLLTLEELLKINEKYEINEVTMLLYDKNHILSMFSQNSDNIQENYDELKKEYENFKGFKFYKALTYEKEIKVNNESKKEKINEIIIYVPGEVNKYTKDEMLIKSIENEETDENKVYTEEEIKTLNSMLSMMYPDVVIEYKEGMKQKDINNQMVEQIDKIYLNDKLVMFKYEPGFEPEEDKKETKKETVKKVDKTTVEIGDILTLEELLKFAKSEYDFTGTNTKWFSIAKYSSEESINKVKNDKFKKYKVTKKVTGLDNGFYVEGIE